MSTSEENNTKTLYLVFKLTSAQTAVTTQPATVVTENSNGSVPKEEALYAPCTPPLLFRRLSMEKEAGLNYLASIEMALSYKSNQARALFFLMGMEKYPMTAELVNTEAVKKALATLKGGALVKFMTTGFKVPGVSETEINNIIQRYQGSRNKTTICVG